jgi:HAMP domain-containing protein
LLVRINLALIAVCALAALAMGVTSRSLLQASAKREAFAAAGLMMDSAFAIRAYTATEIRPLLDDKMKTEFRPQSVPSYAATQNFLKIREQHADYSYKEATLNPTNPRDRTTDWEADIVQRFRNDAAIHEVTGERDTPLGRTLYLARPIRVAAECLVCHSLPDAAPTTLITRYGTNNGFGWQVGEIVGAQIVSVPLASATASADRVFGRLMAWVGGMLIAFVLVANGALYLLIVRPMQQMARIADQVSLNDMSAAEFPAGGGREFAALALSFNRMRKSLHKALQLLET